MTRIAYLDCASGISGDMTLGALIDAGVPLHAVNEAVASLGLPGLRLTASEVRKGPLRATQITVTHEPEHAHRHLADIVELLDRGQLTDRQRDRARRLFTRLAEAEARVHGTTVDRIHFHEVGAADSIADIVGVAVSLDLLGAERVIASPVPTGSGKVTIAHGTVSLPAPATAELLRGVPLAESNVEAELTTPTGAVFLAELVERFGPLPAMTIEQIGYGAGTHDLPNSANVLRLLVGEAIEVESNAGRTMQLLETNLDDETPELIGYTIDRLWQAGALDVWTTPIQMKKNRPGVTLSAVCPAELSAPIEHILLTETTTLGVRRRPIERRTLARRAHTVETPWGPVEGKLATRPDGSTKFSPEYESSRRVASQRGVPLHDVYDAARIAFFAADRQTTVDAADRTE